MATSERTITIRPHAGNATPDVIAAIHAAVPGEPTRIRFETGEYHFYAEGAEVREYYPSNNDGGRKTVVVPLVGCENLTIDGGNSLFVFHGRISPFVADGCRNVTLCNFTQDCGDAGCCEAIVTDMKPDGSFEADIDPDAFRYRVADGVLYFGREFDELSTAAESPLVQEFDPRVTGPAHGQGFTFFYSGKVSKDLSEKPFPIARYEVTEPKRGHLVFTMREKGKRTHRFLVGNVAVIKYENRENPGMYLLDCKDTVIRDVTLWRALGMGVIAQTCENVTLERYRAVSKPGRPGLMSIADDATHFVNCSGLVSITDCRMEHMMDDAVNIHGIYCPVEAVAGNRVTLRLCHGQQKGVNIWKPGDTVDFQRKGTLEVLARPQVLTSELDADKTRVILTLDAPMEGILHTDDLAENTGRMPDVYIAGCHMGHNRPRGVLMTSCGHAVIERNVFYTSQHGVEVCGDSNFWYESGRVRDLTVRNNRFVNCCYNGGDYAVIIAPGFPETNGCFHAGITIEDNLFESFGPGMVYAYSVDGITVRGNRLIPTHAFSPFSDTPTPLCKFEACRNITEEHNTVEQ